MTGAASKRRVASAVKRMWNTKRSRPNPGLGFQAKVFFRIPASLGTTAQFNPSETTNGMGKVDSPVLSLLFDSRALC